MYNFWQKHDKPCFPSVISEEQFNSISFWKDILKQIPPLIRKLAVYYEIPPEKYLSMLTIIFDEKRWDKWEYTAFGQKIRLDNIIGGCYGLENNIIALNPYVYFFEGADTFLHVIYHELAHWIIQQVPYLNEDRYIFGAKRIFHQLDFDMVLKDICEIPESENWSEYRKWKHKNVRYPAYSLNSKLKSIQAYRLEEGTGIYGELYAGEYILNDTYFFRKFEVDTFPE